MSDSELSSSGKKTVVLVVEDEQPLLEAIPEKA